MDPISIQRAVIMLQRITVITSLQGGAGKSTLAAGLAYGFSLRGEKTILFDLNPLSATDDMLLESDSRSPFHLGDVAEGRCTLRDAVFPCPTNGKGALSVVQPSPDPSATPTERNLLHWLELSCFEYDRIVVDIPWHSSCFSAVASRAGTTLVVTEATRYGTLCCDRLRTSPRGQSIRNPRLVLNRFHRKHFWGVGAFRDLDQAIDSCGLQLIAVIPDDPRLQHHIPKNMELIRDYQQQLFRQKEFGGTIALHCLTDRLLGKRVPLRDLDRL